MAVQDELFWGTTSVVTATDVDLDAITMLPNGGYVVAFRQDAKVGFQIYNGNGDKVGGTHFVAAPTTNSSGAALGQWEPSLHTHSDGTFIIGWTEAAGNAGGGRILRHQQFDANGNTVVDNNGNPIIKTVSSTVRYDGAGITDDGAGGWITAYIQDDLHPYIHDVTTGSKGEIKDTNNTSITAAGRTDIARIGAVDYVVSYAANNGLSFVLFKAGSVAAKLNIASVEEARVVALRDSNGNPNGKFAVNYWVSGPNGTKQNIIKTYEPTTGGFNELSSITIPNTSTDSEPYKTDIVALRGGGYAVAYKVGTPPDIHVKIFDAQGSSLESALVIPLPGQQVTPALSELHDGRIALSWHNRYSDTIDTRIIDARVAAVTLTGTGGNDIYNPSKSEFDNFDGGAGIDTLTFKESKAGVAVNLSTQSGSAGDANKDVYKNFENIIGTRFNDTLTGSAVANRLEGGAGDDTLTDVARNGTDTLIGGAGNDTYNVSATNTVIDESGGGYDQVNSSVTYTLSAGIENLFAAGENAIDLTGNGISNIIAGNGAANRLTGHGGDDTLDGSNGNDALDGGIGNDNLVGGSGFDNLQGGAGNDTLDGGGDNDVLSGGDGIDNLSGGDGDDTLNGNGGADVMNGGAGNDTYYIDDANDQIIDGAGIDTVVISTTYDISRLTTIENFTGIGAAAITLTGNAFNNTLTGNDGANILMGGAGNDVLSGGLGNDKLYGQDGNDVLTGGLGGDIFVFDKRPNKRTNVDKITDYNVRDDSIYLENKYFKVTPAGTISKPKQMASKHFYKGTKAHDRDDRIIYDKKGVLYYDPDGTGSAAQIKIATLSKNLKMTYKDFFVI